MPLVLGLLALPVVAAGGSGGDTSWVQVAPAAVLGYRADVTVVSGGGTRHGQIIVTRDGGTHLEHLDEPARGWTAAVIGRAAGPSRGWDDRTDPVRCVWRRLGPNAVLAEVHTPDASVLISRHRPLSAR